MALDEDRPATAGRRSDFLAGGGELGDLIRAHDWSATSLGPPAGWPQSLKTAVRIMLTSRQPIWIGWGPELIYLYNDAYKSIIGGRHPWALGRPTSEVWHEIWSEIAPLLDTAMGGDEGIYVEQQLLIMERNGYPEETYYTFSYSPIPDDDGSPGGIICANTEDTGRVVGERQMALLRELAAGAGAARTWRDACEAAAQAFAADPQDLPFAAIYIGAPGADVLTLAAAHGVADDSPLVPRSVRLAESAAAGEVMRTGEPQVIRDAAARYPTLPSGAWDRPPTEIAILPIPAAGEEGRAGVLAVGLNPYRLFDDAYRGFLGLVAGQVSAAIANAEAYADERRRAESLAELDAAKTTFFSNVSHEFRTPLTLMMSPLEEVLAKGEGEVIADNRVLVELAHRNGLRLLKLVNALLDFSRIEAGRVQAVYEPTDLARLTAELASNFRSATDRAGLKLEVDCPSLAESVFVDREMWEKVVLNLLSNAFKFTFEGGITVRLRAAGGQAILTVTDTGVGIPADEMPHLFERFHRVAGARGRSFEGSGIGLALVHELVKLHGGEIAAESVEDAGTTFTVALPLGSGHLPRERVRSEREAASTAVRAQAYLEEALRWLPDTAVAAAAHEASLGSGAEAGAAPGGSGARILLADDNADMRDYVRRLLSGRHEVETAQDGVAALARVRARKPDLVITDVMMPKLDGFGFVAELRADEDLRDLPVIMLSARAGEEARVEGLDAGADDYVTKPFSARELLASVENALKLSRLRRESMGAVRRSEARFRTLFGAVPVAVFVCGHDGVLQACNSRAAELWGRDPAEIASSAMFGGARSVRDSSGRELGIDDHPVAQVLADGQAREDVELTLEREDGSEVTVLANFAPLHEDGGAASGVVGSFIDISERKRHEAHLRLLLNELNHRVKNTLAAVQSMAVQSLKPGEDSMEGRHRFEARLMALSKAHDVLTRESWEGASLGDVVAAALAPYAASPERFEQSGPQVWLSPRQALALSMALHELGTNAVKYGALSEEGGRVAILWKKLQAEAGTRLQLRWAEAGGPPVSTPKRRGFGTRLIERGLAQDLGGEVAIDFAPSGLVCTIEAPIQTAGVNAFSGETLVVEG